MPSRCLISLTISKRFQKTITESQTVNRKGKDAIISEQKASRIGFPEAIALIT